MNSFGLKIKLKILNLDKYTNKSETRKKEEEKRSFI